MAKAKLVITLNANILNEVDSLVRRGVFPSRSRIIEEAVQEKLERLKISQLAYSGAIRPPIPLQSGPPVPEQTGPGIPL